MNKTKIVATVCHYAGLDKLAYFLNRNRKRTITFHNVLTDDVWADNVANGVSCSLAQFKTIIEEISKRFYFSLDLNDPKSVTVTFDDGYRNQIYVAAPFLRAKGIPAYLFVSGKLIGDGKSANDALVIDQLLHWTGYAPSGKYHVTVAGEDIVLDMTEHNRLAVWCAVVWPTFCKCADTKGQELLDALNIAYPMSAVFESLSVEYMRQRLTGVTAADLQTLVAEGWEIGWHTKSHYPLALLSHEEKLKELTPSESCPSKVLSFPYGGPKEVDADSIEIAKSLGYSTTVSNVYLENALTGEWFRSRMSLPADPILLHFELSGLKHLIKYRRLLPKY